MPRVGYEPLTLGVASRDQEDHKTMPFPNSNIFLYFYWSVIND